jgi:BirA family biotin operon repressor/biotin-[acetyl-CoA-carboxylase] ligase
MALAAEGADAGTVVAADTQLAGRGRLGRPWHSPPGENVYLSAVLRPDITPSAAPPLSLAAAVGVAEALAAFGPACRPVVKWPNDVLVGGSKVAGILTELSAEIDRVRHVVVGVGLNVNTSEFPAELRGTATSLARALSAQLPRAAVAAELLNQLERWFDRLVSDGPKPVIDAWLGRASWLGERIVVNTGRGRVSGVAVGVDPTGALLLRDDRGITRSVLVGDVVLGGGAAVSGR